jgi:hypothetical protein
LWVGEIARHFNPENLLAARSGEFGQHWDVKPIFAPSLIEEVQIDPSVKADDPFSD